MINGEDENGEIIKIQTESEIVNRTTIKIEFDPAQVGEFKVTCQLRIRTEDSVDSYGDNTQEGSWREIGVCPQRVHVGCKSWNSYT